MKESVSAWPSSNPAPRPATSSDVEKRIRVAFVEDDDDYRETVSAALADHGYDALFARSARCCGQQPPPRPK
jgi:two-component system, OmpR family, response regulator ChvI